jgi:hypothetical protein
VPSLEELFIIVPPPASPTAAAGDFAAVEADLGTKLPADYQELVRRYGYGTFSDFLHLWSPFFAPCTMMAQARASLDANRALARVVPKAVPFPPFPEPDGALPWASTDNGDVVYWLTWGAPDAWPVALWNPRAGEKYDLVEGGAAAFLAQWLGGQTRFRTMDAPDFRSFDPWRARVHETIEVKAPAATTFDTRLAAILAAFAPVERRGAYGDEGSPKRQVHFVAEGGAIRLTYDTVYGHNVRLAAPEEGIDDARAKLARAVASFGGTLGRVHRAKPPGG